MSKTINEFDIVYMQEQYNQYLEEHIGNVEKAYEWLKYYLPEIVVEKQNEIEKLIYTHDNSKYSDEEYDAYMWYFYGKNETEEVKSNFDYAWLHHIHNNPHHWQHWVLLNDDDGTQLLEMPYEYIIEMICDHWSFSWKKGNLKEIFNWYTSHKTKILMAPNTRKLYEEILQKIKQELEKR